MTARTHIRARQTGFTLVEAIVAIVLLGIVGSMVAVFIRAPLQGYKESRARAELTELADLSLRRMARDLRMALPNSIRTNGSPGTAIELLLTKSGGRYLRAEDNSPEGVPLSFDDAGQLAFSAVGPLPTGRAAIVPGSDMVVVNNQGTDASVAPANAYLLGGAQSNIAVIAGVNTAPNANLPLITLRSNPFARQEPSMPSESARFQIVSGPVSYQCVPGEKGTGALYRQWNYAITAAQVVPAVANVRADLSQPQSNPLITGVTSCSFDYQPDRSGRGGLVILQLVLQVPNEDAMIRLVHQVHVDNTP
jgi:MSHA biogenesis protein MshO